MWWRLEVERNHAPSPTSMQGLQLAGIGHWHCSGAQRPKKSEIGMRKPKYPGMRGSGTGILLYIKYWCVSLYAFLLRIVY